MSLVKRIVLCIGVTYMFMAISISMHRLWLLGQPTAQVSVVQSIKDLSGYVNTTKGLVLDATPFPQQVFLTYVTDYDIRVIRDSLYFGYTSKSTDEIYTELTANNVNYIIVDSFIKLHNLEFYGCPQLHIIRAYEFIQKYTTPVYFEKGKGIVYKLN